MKTFKQLISEIYKPKSPDEQKFINLHKVETKDYPVSNKDDLPFKDNKIKEPGPQHKKGPYHSDEESEEAYEKANDGVYKEEWNSELNEDFAAAYAKHNSVNDLQRMHTKYKKDIESLPKDSKYSTYGHLVDKEYHIRKALKSKGVNAERAKHDLVIENIFNISEEE